MDTNVTAGRKEPDVLHVAIVTETYPPEVNGVALTLARLIDGLRRHGHRIQLIRPRQGRRHAPADEPGFREMLIPGVPIPGYPGLRFGLPVRRDLTRHWRTNRPDIVHVATEGPLGMAAVAAARRLGLAVSSGYHTNFQAYSRHYRIGWLQGLVSAHLKRFHNRTALTLVPTREMAQRLIASGYRGVGVIARGVDTALFSPSRRSTPLRRSWGAEDDTLVVLYVGRLAPEKNLPLVTRAFEAIRARRPCARLVFVGDGPALASLRHRHPESIFAGVRRGAELAAHYASADLFLFPSLTETWGNVVPEALASGLGVVAFDCAAAADLIRNGDNGLTASPGDDEAFVRAAADLAGDRQTLTRLRTRAAGSVAGLRWEYIQDRFIEALRSVVAEHRSACAAKLSHRNTPADGHPSPPEGGNAPSMERQNA